MIQWIREYPFTSETLTLCRHEGNFVLQITTGPEIGDDFVGLFSIDSGDQIQMGNSEWEAVSEAPPEVLREIETEWEPGIGSIVRI